MSKGIPPEQVELFSQRRFVCRSWNKVCSIPKNERCQWQGAEEIDAASRGLRRCSEKNHFFHETREAEEVEALGPLN